MAPARKICPECGDELYAMHLPRHLLTEHGIRPEPKVSRPSEGSTAPVDDPPSTPTVGPSLELEAAPALEETAPRKPGRWERFRARARGRRAPATSSPATGERAPKRRVTGGRRRIPLDTDISDVWAFAGRRLERKAHYPTGRMLEFQAPGAGVILDTALAGTLPDRVLLQPLARNRDKYEAVGFLIAGPLLTFTMTTTMQQMAVAHNDGDAELEAELAAKLQMQREMFSWVVQMMLPRLAEGAKRAREKKEKADAAIADAFPDLGDADPVEVFIQSVFVPPTYSEASQNGSSNSTAPNPTEQGSVSF